jgi:hypothetical protein
MFILPSLERQPPLIYVQQTHATQPPSPYDLNTTGTTTDISRNQKEEHVFEVTVQNTSPAFPGSKATPSLIEP